MSVNDIRAQLASEVGEPVFTEGMTRAERRTEMDRWHATCKAQIKRLDAEHMRRPGIDRQAAACLTHELIWSWATATASRWFLALPERYMTPDDMRRPDWDHNHYPHDEHGHIGRVTTRQRPEPEPGSEEARQIALVRKILADINNNNNNND